jgi:uncharacterized membrane protein YphA (DoxX/SURF4 family)
VATAGLLEQSIARLQAGASIQPVALAILEISAALLLSLGLWTPIAGAIAALAEVWSVFLHPGDPWISIRLGTLGVALALLGPGAWSVDARLFGWKRIDIRDRSGSFRNPKELFPASSKKSSLPPQDSR